MKRAALRDRAPDTMPRINRLLSVLIGARGNIRRVPFTEDRHRYECYVPEDGLWDVVKPNLIVTEYERAGIHLRQFHGVVLDAGAHVGLFSLRAATYASRVVAMEPHPANFALLRLNVLRNEARAIEPRQVALWQSSGEVDLFEGGHTAEGSLVRSGNRRHNVRAVTLDEVISELGAVDLLKLDIEGAEFPVLENALDDTLKRVGAIAAELHVDRHPERIQVIVDRLRSVGFDVTLLRPPVYFWRDSTARVLRNWGNVENVTRLKLMVLLTYTATALLDSVTDLRDSARLDDIMFLYARRPAA